MSDPWEEFHLEKLETEVVCRYRFNAIRQTWIKDEVLIKIAKDVSSDFVLSADVKKII